MLRPFAIAAITLLTLVGFLGVQPSNAQQIISLGNTRGILRSQQGGTGINNAYNATLGGALTTAGVFTTTTQMVITMGATAAPAGTACDAVGETGSITYDATGDVLYICSGASGWRKVATEAP